MATGGAHKHAWTKNILVLHISSSYAKNIGRNKFSAAGVSPMWDKSKSESWVKSNACRIVERERIERKGEDKSMC